MLSAMSWTKGTSTPAKRASPQSERFPSGIAAAGVGGSSGAGVTKVCAAWRVSSKQLESILEIYCICFVRARQGPQCLTRRAWWRVVTGTEAISVNGLDRYAISFVSNIVYIYSSVLNCPYHV